MCLETSNKKSLILLGIMHNIVGLVAPRKGANERSYRAQDSLSQLSEPSQCYPSGPIFMIFVDYLRCGLM